ncbi:GNAT family acetyltransferase [bacterium]|nr:GNAT family acetyltransferase [bacterium]
MPHPVLTIRTCRPSDEADLIQLWIDCGLTRPWNNPKQDIDRKLAHSPDGFLIGEVEGKLVASVMAGYDGHRGWIYYLAVHPEMQRHGFGEQMMDAAETYLREQGAPKINLEVRIGNEKVIRFYDAIGYVDNEIVGWGKRLVEDAPYQA